MNIYDIAKEAGVSISTVSRVLNNPQNVSEDKRNRVLKVLKKTKYIPSRVARSLANRTTKTIAVLLVDVSHIHYANISFIIEQMMTINGYSVILCNTGYTQLKMKKYMERLAESQVDGIIMVGSIYNNDVIYKCIKNYFSNMPIIMHNSSVLKDNIYNIRSNGDVGIKQSIDYLMNKNYKNIVFVKDSNTSVSNNKVDTYVKVMKEYGIQVSDEDIVKVKSGISGGTLAAEYIEGLQRDYNAIVGCEDITCIGIIKQLKKQGKKIPEDMAIIGFNNSLYSEICEPQLTSVDSKHEEIAIQLSQTMINVLNGIHEPHIKDIYPELVIRQTT